MNKFSKSLVALAAAAGLFLARPLDAIAQREFGGKPLSLSQTSQTGSTLRSISAEEQVIDVPLTVNLDDYKESANWESENHGAPLRVGIVLDIDIDFARDAQRVTLADGSVIYKLHLRSEGAVELSPTYKDFFIPEGGKLYTYDPQGLLVRGAYTYETHKRGGYFASANVPGDEIVFEYQPNEKGEMPRIEIEGLIHYFRHTMDLRIGDLEDRSTPAEEINVNCPQGDDWKDQKAGVCQILMGGSICTGNLMNNTKGDFKPLILSAAHCASITENLDISESKFAQWKFTFHYEKPSCTNAQYSQTALTKSVVGCKKPLAFLPLVGMSDGLLLELLDEIPEDYRVYYNGWNRQTGIPSSVVGIHHPAGDAMKISLLGESGTEPSYTTWHEGLNDAGAPKAHFYFSFQEGNTEGGSSGSSLFNQNKLVIGTLTGGGERTQFYGRLDFHWDKFKDKGTSYQMGTFLDPIKQGKERSLAGTFRNDMQPLYPISKVQAMPTKEPGEFVIVWNAPSSAQYAARKYGNENVVYKLYRNGARVPGLEVQESGKSSYFLKDKPKESDFKNGKVSYHVRVVYSGLSENSGIVYFDSDPVAAMAITPITSVTPNVAKATGGTEVTWSAPAFNQEWTKVDYTLGEDNFKYQEVPMPFLRRIDNQQSQQKRCIFVEKWMPGYLPESLDGQGATPLYIKQINFVPAKADQDFGLFVGYNYSLRKDSDHKTVEEKIESTPENVGKWQSVILKKPMKLDLMQTLLVGFTTHNFQTTQRPLVNLFQGSGGDGISKINSPQALYTGYKVYGTNHYQGELLGGALSSTYNYFALKLIVSSDPTPLTEPITEVQYGGSLLAHVPVIKEYVVKKDGQVLETLKPNRFSYLDNNNQTGTGNYTVEVVYHDLFKNVPNQEITKQSETFVYPTEADNTLWVKGGNAISMIEVFSANGVRIRQWMDVRSDVSLDISDLSAGSYIVVLHTDQGKRQQKVTKK
ncbi:Protease 1 precursor [Porphyromonas crevioricanis]|uniref:Protease 1 n=1 Tax=Porphyromonas crevioricanis TaxID=393921 RepID=A0A2X4SW17_9PORP|nr:T9SS type A sorting domain-containing protein [Porphyromonas crevioricanis]GAD07164.1 lysyl endopeptidase [Porphyromonas crevioricanis JCM 13913]SQH73941.1 Protease 1 precursor [Porphyromonas crevioricanis]